MLRRAAVPVLAALALAACGQGSETDSSTSSYTPAATTKPAKPFRVKHILIAFTSPSKPNLNRTPEAALALAKDVLADIKAGRRTFDEMVQRMTDDRNAEGAPNGGNMLTRKDEPPGTYVFFDGMVPEFMHATRNCKVGEVYPDPVRTEYGYHLIFRQE